MAEDDKLYEALSAEAATLRRRVAELEARDRDRDRVEAELRASLELLQLVIDSVPQGLFWKGPDFLYLGANRRTVMKAGFTSSEEMRGKDDSVMPWSLDAEQFRAEDRRVFETGATIQDEALYQRTDGAKAWLRRAKVPVRDRSGRVLLVLGMTEDITERKQLQDALSESQRLLQLMMDNLPQRISWKDGRLLYLGCNKSFAREAGVEAPGQIVGKSDFELPWSAHAERLQAADRRVIETGAPEHVEEPIEREHGDPGWSSESRIPVRDGEGQVIAVLSLSEDITERKRRAQEQERARVQDEIIRMQSELLAELSTPLIPVSQGVLAMPLVGPLDAARTALVMETLLRGIHRARARVAILDITGVRGVNEQVADAIARVARTVRLLGAEVVLTGVRPEVARALVESGFDLGGIVTEQSLESGIAYAARR